MSVTPPPALTAIPPFPALSDRAAGTYNSKAYAFGSHLSTTFNAEVAAVAANVAANATDAAASAGSAETSATLAAGAAAVAGAVAWVSGTTYAIGDARYSPANFQTYRRLTSGAGITDPSADAANWVRVNLVGALTRVARTSNTALAKTDEGRVFDLSSSFTQTLSAAATMGAGWHCYLRNAGNGDITVDPNGAELIDGAATYTLKPGFTVMLTCDGSAFTVIVLVGRTYNNVAQYTGSSTLTVPAGCYVMRPYAFGAGSAATTSAGGAGGGCAYGDIAVTPGQTLTLTISAGVAKVVFGGVTLLTANAASGVTAGTASKHASVTNGGAYSGGAGAVAAGAGGASSGSPLGAGFSGGTSGGGAGWGGTGGGGTSGGGGGAGSAGSGQGAGGGLSYISTDPLLAPLTGIATPGNAPGSVPIAVNGQPGAGGTHSSAASCAAGAGGFGGGGGLHAALGFGGPGGFGGGGGGSVYTGGAGGTGGTGGFGAGGGGVGHASGVVGQGGGAVIRIYY